MPTRLSRAKNITPGTRAEAQAVDLQKWLGLKDFTAVTRYCLMRVWTEEWMRRGGAIPLPAMPEISEQIKKVVSDDR
jgi:hypothetical protein